MSVGRLTRDEKRARTRESLIDAAGREFAERGFHGASLDHIAEVAGFSKGAIYSNFASKEDLFLAVLDRHNEEQRASLAETLARGTTVEERLAAVGAWFRRVLETDREWTLLALEFTMYAARNPEVRSALADRDAETRQRITELIGAQAADLGLDLPVPAPTIATAILAMGTGLSITRLIDGDDVPDAVFPTAVALLLGVGLGEPSPEAER